MERIKEITTMDQFTECAIEVVRACGKLQRNVDAIQGMITPSTEFKPHIFQEMIESCLVDAENLIYNFCVFKETLGEKGYDDYWALRMDEIQMEANFKILTLLKLKLPVIEEDMKGLVELKEKEESGDEKNE